MKVIFLDVDGVLNNAWTAERSPGGYTGVSDELIRNLKKIVSATGAKIVLSSDWRLVRHHLIRSRDYRYLAGKLQTIGNLKISGHTDDISWNRRGAEISKYLEDHPEITEFVILDDIPFSDFFTGKLSDHLVLTDSGEGLTDADAAEAVQILQEADQGQ